MAQVKISGLPTGTASTVIEIPATDPNDLSTPTGKTFKYTLSDITTVTGAVANGGTGANAVGANGTLAQSDGTKYTFTQATYPSSTNKSHILYSSANNTVGEIGTAKNAVLVSDNQSVPQWTSKLDDGQIIIGKTNDLPAAANITAGTNIQITTGANSLTIASTGGTVSSGLINQLAWYAANGSTVSGLTTANNGLLVTSAGGVPSIGNSVGADVAINTVNIGKGGGSIATNTRVGVTALAANTTGARNVAMGYQALQSSNAANSSDNVVIGNQAAPSATTIYSMTLLGSGAGLSYTTSNNSVAVGTNSLRTATTGGDRSVAIGVNALYTTNGAVNTALGYRAGEAFTGNNGLFIGGNAGASTTGNDNTIIGADAATALTTGSNNTLIGRQAGSSQTTGSSCTSIGYRAAQSSTTASDITAVGTNALRLSTVADNTAIGSGAMDACTTGGGTAVGKDALGAMTTGTGNIAIGTSALSLITTGAESTAVGFQAGTADTGGSNVHIGWQAGVNITSGQANVSIGRRAGRIYSTGNENIAIGNNAMGNGFTAATQYSIFIGSTAGISCTGNNNTAIGHAAGASAATGAVTLTTGTSNTMLGYRSCSNAADAVGTISIGADAVAEKATGVTSADNGPGIAIGSAAFKVGFRGDGTIYPTAGAISGYMQIKINGTAYKLALYALS